LTVLVTMTRLPISRKWKVKVKPVCILHLTIQIQCASLQAVFGLMMAGTTDMPFVVKKQSDFARQTQPLPRRTILTRKQRLYSAASCVTRVCAYGLAVPARTIIILKYSFGDKN